MFEVVIIPFYKGSSLLSLDFVQSPNYQNCILATLGKTSRTVVRMLVAFPMFVNETAAPEDDPVLAPYRKSEENNSYYICGVAVFPEYRNRVIGTQLMALAETHAVTKGFAKLSPIVFEQNQGAKRLYDRLGYREVNREAIVSHPLIHYSGDALLMIKEMP